jgi:hypothetical protein
MNAQQVWQTQAIEAPRISLEYVRHRTSSLEQRTRWRNALEYVVGVCALIMFVSFGLRNLPEKPIMFAAHGWFALWSLFYMYWWHRLAATQATPADAGVLDNLRYQRRQLERQRDARLDSWRWWGLPSLPGFLLFLVSSVVEDQPVRWGMILFLVSWAAAGIGTGVWLMNREARRFQREIDALDSLAGAEPG